MTPRKNLEALRKALRWRKGQERVSLGVIHDIIMKIIPTRTPMAYDKRTNLASAKGALKAPCCKSVGIENDAVEDAVYP